MSLLWAFYVQSQRFEMCSSIIKRKESSQMNFAYYEKKTIYLSTYCRASVSKSNVHVYKLCIFMTHCTALRTNPKLIWFALIFRLRGFNSFGNVPCLCFVFVALLLKIKPHIIRNRCFKNITVNVLLISVFLKRYSSFISR